MKSRMANHESRIQKPRRRVVRRTEPVASSEPHILSAEEKRELILAHAAARQPMDPFQRLTIAIGVAVCVIVVAGAWLYTLDGTIKSTMARSNDQSLQQATDSIKQVGSTITESTNGLGKAADDIVTQLNVLNERDALVHEIVTQIATTSTREDLFKPTTSSTNR